MPLVDGMSRRAALHRFAKVEHDAVPSLRPLPHGRFTLTSVTPTRLSPVPYVQRRLRASVATSRLLYRDLCAKVEAAEAAANGHHWRMTEVQRRARSKSAREAVLKRSQERCENPECLLLDGNLPYRTSTGGLLLEVDHLEGHAAGGRDQPEFMIALCPNCHANKTFGAEKAELTERLLVVAARRHAHKLSETASEA
ncbi:HNH endonuclease [Streptomyces erythrochromogenes]|uniref:HNH endonuclease n=1 Tax=Streptomyces erythrochromogenes TaxID=285574 RepID=UPI0036CE058D